jgi:hypothetical protein
MASNVSFILVILYIASRGAEEQGAGVRREYTVLLLLIKLLTFIFLATRVLGY